MYLIHSYSHSFRTRDVKAGKVYDVVFRVTDERGNVRQKRLSGFATKQNAENIPNISSRDERICTQTKPYGEAHIPDVAGNLPVCFTRASALTVGKGFTRIARAARKFRAAESPRKRMTTRGASP